MSTTSSRKSRLTARTTARGTTKMLRSVSGLLGVLGVCASCLACDATAEETEPAAPERSEPSGSAPAQPPKEVPKLAVPNAGALIKEASLKLEAPGKMIPVHATVLGTIGTLEKEHNRVYLRVACEIGGRRYVETERELSPKSGAPFEITDRLFGGIMWSSEGPLGDCDAWLTIRESLGAPQFRESLVAASCRRDEVWTSEGCPALPPTQAPQPIGEKAADVEVVWARPTDFLRTWGLKVVFDYAIHQHIHPDYDLGATVRCTAGAESTEYWDDASHTDLSDMEPGERSRGIVSINSDDGMSKKPERCEIQAAIRNGRKKDEVYPLQAFCWTPDAMSPGKCTKPSI